MKRFKFRLESVLRIRRIEEEQSRARLLAANAAVARADAIVATRRSHYAALTRPKGAQTRAAIDDAWATLDRAARAIVWSDTQRVECIERAREAHEAWSQTRQRVRALERLRDSAVAKHVQAIRRDNDRVADELATTRYRRRKATV